MNQKIGLSYSQPAISSVLQRVTTNKIIIPDIQRDLVWSNDMKRKFLGSIVHNYPFGTIILAKKNGSDEEVILDGLQRLTTLYDISLNCYKYAKDFKEYLFNHFKEEIWADLLESYELYKMSNPDIMDINDERFANELEDYFYKSFDQWSKLEQIRDYENESIDFNSKILSSYSGKLQKCFRKTYEYFMKSDLDFAHKLIPIQLFEGSDGEIADIFQIINEQGRKLTEFEILKAKLSLTTINKDVYLNVWDEIKDYKKKQFVNLLTKFKNDMQVLNNDTLSYYDALYYAIYSAVNENNYLHQMSFFKSIFDNGTIENDWFKIVNFIIASHTSENREIDINDTSSSIISFFKSKDNIDLVSEIKNNLSDVFETLKNIMILPNIKAFKKNQFESIEDKIFSKSEVLLIVAVYYKAKLLNIELSKKDILLNLMRSAVRNDFRSGSTKKALSILDDNEYFSELDTLTIKRLLSGEVSGSINTIMKILTNLVTCNNNIENIYGKTIITPKLLNQNPNKSGSNESIFNILVICNDSSMSKYKENNFMLSDYEKDFFFINCDDEHLKNQYLEFIQNKIINQSTISLQEMQDFYDCRKNMIFNYIEREL